MLIILLLFEMWNCKCCALMHEDETLGPRTGVFNDDVLRTFTKKCYENGLVSLNHEQCFGTDGSPSWEKSQTGEIVRAVTQEMYRNGNLVAFVFKFHHHALYVL